MANEIDALINVKDASGVLNEIYPITKKENVQGLMEFISNSLSGYLPKSGGTMTGPIIITNGIALANSAEGEMIIGFSDGGDLIVGGQNARVEITHDGIIKLIINNNFLNVTPNGIFIDILSDITKDNQLTTKKYVDSLKPKAKTVTLSSTGWTASGDVYTQTATVSGVSATETAQEIHVTPATASMTAYMKAGVYASAQAANQITFTASKVPTVDLTVYALIKTL